LKGNSEVTSELIYLIHLNRVIEQNREVYMAHHTLLVKELPFPVHP
jgi:hypothetical protein